MLFKNRAHAGDLLALKLLEYKNNKDAIVIALPRGGVAVAQEVAKKLNLPLDVIISRKIGHPASSELAIGALTQNGQIYLDQDYIKSENISDIDIEREIDIQKIEAKRRYDLYRKDKEILNLKDKIVIIVDDGVATGATMIAAVKEARVQEAKKIIVAVPVITVTAFKLLFGQIDQLIYLSMPEFFPGISYFYEIFNQLTDQEVIDILNQKN